MKILIDMDEVLAQFLKGFCDKINHLYDINLKENDFDVWDIPTVLNRYLINNTSQIPYKEKGFFLNLQPFGDAIEMLRKINRKYDVFICSDPPTADGCYEKVLWLNRHFPFIEQRQIIFTAHKHMVKADIILDDAPKHLESFDGITVAMDRLYNKHVKTDYRVSNMYDFYHLLLTISK